MKFSDLYILGETTSPNSTIGVMRPLFITPEGNYGVVWRIEKDSYDVFLIKPIVLLGKMNSVQLACFLYPCKAVTKVEEDLILGV